jgi:hypothetical protein
MHKTIVKLYTVPSGTLLYDGVKWQDVKYISDKYYLKTLTFSGGDTVVKAIRLFYNRAGKQVGELTSGYSAKNASELLKKYDWLQ